MDIERLELGNGKFEVLRIGNMRFERLSQNGDPDTECWVGIMEKGDIDLPIFASSNKPFTVEQISRCCEAIEKFLEVLEEERKRASVP
ncbi:MAG: hypothetical protein QXJ68_04135 [Methanocellales archaeon]